jgi:hypothetical protein
MAIDFNQDIAPLRQQYFPMLMGERGFDQAMKYRQEVLMPMQQETLKMQRDELAYKHQKMAFRQQRDNLRREREASNVIPMIEDRLRDIRTSDEDLQKKREAFTDLAMGNIGLINSSPTIASMFDFQDKLLKNNMAVQAAEKQKEQAFRNSVANSYYQSTFNTEDYDEGTHRDILEGGASPQEVSNSIFDIKTKKAATEAAKKAEEDKRKAEFKRSEFEIKEAEDIQTDIDGVEYTTEYENERDKVGFPVLKPEDYRKAISNYIKLSGTEMSRSDAERLYPRKRSIDLITTMEETIEAERSKFYLGDSSRLTPKGKENRSKIQQAINPNR